MCRKTKHFRLERELILCRYTSKLSPVTRDILVADYTQAFMLMLNLIRSGAIDSELDFEMKPVVFVVGGDAE